MHELVEHYDVRALLASAACLTAGAMPDLHDSAPTPAELIDDLRAATANRALAAVLGRLQVVLAPYARGEAACWTADDPPRDAASRARWIGRYHRHCRTDAAAIIAYATRNISGI
jgi:hypothetical protein